MKTFANNPNPNSVWLCKQFLGSGLNQANKTKAPNNPKSHLERLEPTPRSHIGAEEFQKDNCMASCQILICFSNHC